MKSGKPWPPSLYEYRAAKGAGMKKTKDIKSNHVTQNKATYCEDCEMETSIRYNWLLEITERLYKGMLELQKWGDIPISGSLDNEVMELAKKRAAKDGTNWPPTDFIELPVRNIIKLMYFLPSVDEGITVGEIFKYIENLANITIQDKQSLEHCYKCCGYLLFLKRADYNDDDDAFILTDEDKEIRRDYEYFVFTMSYEALGYWTAKLEGMKINKEKRNKRRTWGGLTKEEIEKRNQRIIDKFNDSTLTMNHFAIEYQNKFQLKPSQIRTIIRESKNK